MEEALYIPHQCTPRILTTKFKDRRVTPSFSHLHVTHCKSVRTGPDLSPASVFEGFEPRGLFLDLHLACYEIDKPPEEINMDELYEFAGYETQATGEVTRWFEYNASAEVPQIYVTMTSDIPG